MDATTFRFNTGQAQEEILAFFKEFLPNYPHDDHQFVISGCLLVWLEQVLRKIISAKDTTLDKAASSIKDKVAAQYKLAAIPLTTRLGPFCSYCESPLSGIIEVEHCIPKSNYPDFALTWDNFLISCGACNTAKSNTPNRLEVMSWFPGSSLTEEEFYIAIREHYAWPDIDATGQWIEDFMAFTVDEGKTWQRLEEYTNEANPGNTLYSVDIATRTVGANILYAGSIELLNVMVLEESNAQDAEERQCAENMIELCGLNADPDCASTYDRRALNRTLAWFTCLKSISNYQQVKTPAMQELLWDQLRMTAAATGFYSIWVKLLSRNVFDKYEEFQRDPIFPGTDLERL